MICESDSDSSEDYYSCDEAEYVEERGTKRVRKRNPLISGEELWNSPWGLMMRSDEIKDPISSVAMKFRLRFRVPFPVFTEYLVVECNRLNVFNMKRCGSIPIEFKLLVVLRMLARGNDLDTINELSMIPQSTCNKLFHDFTHNFVELFLHKHVHMPEGNELRCIMNTYKSMGFNGAIGSIDCTHVYLNKCPKEYVNLCTGKEKKPTLAFQCVVSHDRKCLLVSDAFFGSFNDKQIVKSVKETLDLIAGKYENVTFTLYDENGNSIYCRGAYVIADAGFLQIACIIDPSRGDSYSISNIRWCEFLESIRKDVECFFGILKGRFRYLLNPINTHNFSTISNAFKTCCILHNIILEYDTHCYNEMSLWEDAEVRDVDVLDPVNDGIIEEALQRIRVERVQNMYQGLNYLQEPMPTVGNNAVNRIQFSADSKHDYVRLRSMLRTSFTSQFNAKQIYWPRRFSDHQKNLFPLERISARITQEVFHALYRDKSNCKAALRVHGKLTDQYEVSLGYGLFSTIDYNDDDVIAQYHGELLTREEAQVRIANNNCRYMIALSKTQYLTCHNTVVSGQCKGSLANSPTNCWDFAANRKAQENAKIRIHTNDNGDRIALLRATKTIPSGTEILTKYGVHFNLTERSRVMSFN